MEHTSPKTAFRLPRLLSAVGVVLSLAFVGTEIRQNTAALRAETRQGLAQASRDFSLALSTDPEMRRVYYAMWRPDLDGGRGGSTLTSADTLHARVILFTVLRSVENVFLQSLEGVVDASVLNSYGFVDPVTRAPFFAPFWENVRSRFDERFVLAFEEANALR